MSDKKFTKEQHRVIDQLVVGPMLHFEAMLGGVANKAATLIENKAAADAVLGSDLAFTGDNHVISTVSASEVKYNFTINGDEGGQEFDVEFSVKKREAAKKHEV